jgi:hypothetical protein
VRPLQARDPFGGAIENAARPKTVPGTTDHPGGLGGLAAKCQGCRGGFALSPVRCRGAAAGRVAGGCAAEVAASE